MFLSHETKRGAFCFPFFKMSEMVRFLPRTVRFWDDNDGGICDKLLEFEGGDAMDGRAGRLACNSGKGCVVADSCDALQLQCPGKTDTSPKAV